MHSGDNCSEIKRDNERANVRANVTNESIYASRKVRDRARANQIASNCALRTRKTNDRVKKASETESACAAKGEWAT